jgi:phosphate transport system protein
MSIALRKELTQIRQHVLAMGAVVEQRVAEVIDALLQRDVEEARIVRHGDDDIDAMELDLEAECIRVLALSQPVASDLRFVLAVTRINTELERIGDMAKSIAKRVIAFNEHSAGLQLPSSLEEMAGRTLKMLRDALRALEETDVQLSRDVRHADDPVDELLKELFDWTQQQIVSDVAVTAAAIDLLSIARKLERIADVTTNIAEDVIYIAKGEVVRHTSA